MRWDKLFEGAASGINTGAQLRNQYETRKLKQTELEDNLLTSEQSRGLKDKAEARTAEMQPGKMQLQGLQVSGAQQTQDFAATNQANSIEDRDQTRARDTADRAALKSTVGEGYDSQEVPVYKPVARTEGESDEAYASKNKANRAEFDKRESQIAEDNARFESATDPKRAQAFVTAVSELNEAKKDPNVSPQALAAMDAKVKKQAQFGFENSRDLAQSAIKAGEYEAAAAAITQASFYDKDQNMIMQSRWVPAEAPSMMNDFKKTEGKFQTAAYDTSKTAEENGGLVWAEEISPDDLPEYLRRFSDRQQDEGAVTSDAKQAALGNTAIEGQQARDLTESEIYKNLGAGAKSFREGVNNLKTTEAQAEGKLFVSLLDKDLETIPQADKDRAIAIGGGLLPGITQANEGIKVMSTVKRALDAGAYTAQIIDGKPVFFDDMNQIVALAPVGAQQTAIPAG